MGISLTMMFSLFQVNYFFDMPNQLMTLFPFVLTGVILIAALVLSIQTGQGGSRINVAGTSDGRSEEHTSELQSRGHLVCRRMLVKNTTRAFCTFINYAFNILSVSA